ncbi:hypothetical protein SAMN05444412_104166 [Rhodonellum ikkaensis]|uniref:Uncharacterized protein n=1 Tax=Rhodonellum ikkaensis TaxID=336829 RepID=A0A1H3PAQ0_9BACT|nr:hypothetical protein SAMN05444412_104166 [Rhodonellum ikkaensis]
MDVFFNLEELIGASFECKFYLGLINVYKVLFIKILN